MIVAFEFASVEGRDLEGGLDAAVGCVCGVFRKFASNALDGALYVGDKHVPHLEFGSGVGRIDFPSDDSGGCGGGCCHGRLLHSLSNGPGKLRTRKARKCGLFRSALAGGKPSSQTPD
jgi:hypothetical protein